MNVLEAMSARRAVRAYTPVQIDDAVLRSLLRAAVQAPSAMNRQPWLFAVVQDVKQLKRYSERAKAMAFAEAAGDPKAGQYREMLQSAEFNIFYDASTLVAIGVAEQGRYAEADCWLAAENLMLAAREVGLGSCPIGFAIPVLNAPDVKNELGFPATGVAVAAIILGHSAAEPPPVPRKDPRITCWTKGAQ